MTAAAMELFWQRGYHDVSTRELVDAMEINMNTLYSEFGTKAGLFSAAIEHYDPTPDASQHSMARYIDRLNNAFANALHNSATGAADVTAVAQLLTATMLGLFVMIRAQTSATLLQETVDTALDYVESKLG